MLLQANLGMRLTLFLFMRACIPWWMPDSKFLGLCSTLTW